MPKTRKTKYNPDAAKARKRRLEKQALAKEKAFFSKYTKPILITLAAIIAAAVIISVAVDYFYAPNGTIREFHGNLIGTKPNWIIANCGTSSKPQCYKVAEYDMPMEGYTLDADMNTTATELTRSQYYRANEEDKLISSVFVGPVNGKSAQLQAQTLIDYGLYTLPEDLNGVQDGKIGGYDCKWIYGLYYDTDEEGNQLETASATLGAYIDAVGGNSVLLSLSTAKGDPSALPDSVAMFEQAELFAKGLTVCTE